MCVYVFCVCVLCWACACVVCMRLCCDATSGACFIRTAPRMFNERPVRPSQTRSQTARGVEIRISECLSGKGGQKPLQPLQKGPNLERGQGDVFKFQRGCQSEWGGAPLPVTSKVEFEDDKNIANPHPPLSVGTADHTPSRKRVLRSFFLLVPPTLAPLQQPCKWVSQQLTQSRASSRICLFSFDYDRRHNVQLRSKRSTKLPLHTVEGNPMSTACSACGSISAPAELLTLLRTLIANNHSQQVSDESVTKENREDCGYVVRCGARVHCLCVCIICQHL